jgi:hypothetical protein
VFGGGEVDLEIESRPGGEEEVWLGQLDIGAGGACLGVSALEPEDDLRDIGLDRGGDAVAARAYAGEIAGVGATAPTCLMTLRMTTTR